MRCVLLLLLLLLLLIIIIVIIIIVVIIIIIIITIPCFNQSYHTSTCIAHLCAGSHNRGWVFPITMTTMMTT